MGLGAVSEVGSLLYAVVIPLYRSIKSIRSAETFDDKQWLSYWCIFGVLTIFEQLFRFLSFLPFYYEVKAVILVFLVKKNGARLAYERFVAPAFDHVEKYVEDPSFRKEANKKIAERSQELVTNVTANIKSMQQPSKEEKQ